MLTLEEYLENINYWGTEIYAWLTIERVIALGIIILIVCSVGFLEKKLSQVEEDYYKR